MDFLNLNLDKTLSGNSNTTISSQKALKSYIDAKRILLNFLQDQPPTTYNTGDKWLNTSTKKLYIATSSSNWGNPIDLNIDQVYSFENLFYHYDGTNILNYSTESITEQNNNYEIKTWFGTQNEYDALDNYDANTLYNIVDNASILSSLLATQTEFNNSVSNKAATPYQVNQALGNYLPLAGGNLDAGAILRLTNTNNNTVALAYNTNNYLTISNNLSVSGNITTNSLIASTGNIYNGSTTGPKVIWNNNYATSSAAGIVKPDNTTLTVDNTGTLTVIGGAGGGGSVILLQFLQSTTPTTYSTNDKWLNISDYKLYTATSSSTWDSGQSITEDQIFGFNNLLYHYDGTNLIIYSTESVKNQNDGVEIKTWVGTQDEYNSISTYDNNTIYNIINSDTSITNQYHPPLLSFKWSEHKFNSLSWLRADTFSWQNGNAYKAGYQELLSEYNNPSSTMEIDGGEWVSSNITPFGSLIDDEGIISGFTSNTTFASFNAITPTSSFEIVVKCKQDTLNANSSIIFNDTNGLAGITFRVVNASTGQINMWVANGSSAVISNVNTNATLSANTWTWFKIAWDGTDITVSQSTDGTTYTQTYTNTLSTPPAFSQGRQTLGGGARETYAFTNGYIDLNECYLDIDGERYWTGCNYTPIITYKRTPRDYKIADATQEQAILDLYNSTGVARYFILDTANTRFKLARWKHNKYQATAPVKGNGMTLGLTDGTNNYGLEYAYYNTTSYGLQPEKSWYGKDISSTSVTPPAQWAPQGAKLGITTDPTKSGIEATLDTDDMYLYFYVGNFTQSAIEQTAGLNSELLNGKVDISSLEEVQCVVETYSNGTEWYRVWSDGWCEQGGIKDTSGSVTFLKPFINTNYIITTGMLAEQDVYYAVGVHINPTPTTTGFSASMWNNSSAGGDFGSWYWRAEGYIA